MPRADLSMLALTIAGLASAAGYGSSRSALTLGLIPSPQHCRPIETTFDLTADTPILLAGRAGDQEFLAARLLQRRITALTGLRLPILSGQAGRGIRLHLANSPEGLSVLSRYDQLMPYHAGNSARGWRQDYRYTEEYFLHVSARTAVVIANTPQGLLHGAMSLSQLVTPENMILGCEVRDWPETRLRGVHVRLAEMEDRKGVTPSFAELKRLVETMALFKLNHLFLEPGRHVELPSLPGLWRLDGLSVEQQRKLKRFAEALGVQIVPVLPSWSEVTTWREASEGAAQPPALQVLEKALGDLDRNLSNGDVLHLGGRGDGAKVDGYARFYASLIERVRRHNAKRLMLWAMDHTTPTEVLAEWPDDVIVLPHHPTNPRGGWYGQAVQTADVWAQALGAGRAQVGFAFDPLETADDASGLLASAKHRERQISLWAQAVYALGRDELAMGLVMPMVAPSFGANFEVDLTPLCWLAELTWNDAHAGSMPNVRFDRAVGWHVCGVPDRGERAVHLYRELTEAVAQSSAGMKPSPDDIERLRDRLRRLSFGSAQRSMQAGLCSIARRVLERVTPSQDTASGARLASASEFDPPHIVTTGERIGATGRTMRFDASASRDADGVPCPRAVWDFGDGRQSVGLTVEHAYQHPGTYVATLTVSDAAGREAREPILVVVRSKDTALAAAPSNPASRHVRAE